jgi:hypothetical protein
MAGSSSEDHLSKAALGVSSLDEKIGVQLGCVFEDGLACRLTVHSAHD